MAQITVPVTDRSRVSGHALPLLFRSGASWGDHLSEDATIIVESLAARTTRPGDALPAALHRFIREEYVEPRAREGRESFGRIVSSGRLAEAMERASVSRIRRVLRNVPRAVLVDAAADESIETKRRFASLCSRRGRRVFFEDIEAREAAIRRESWFDFAPLIRAKRQVYALVHRSAPSASKSGS